MKMHEISSKLIEGKGIKLQKLISKKKRNINGIPSSHTTYYIITKEKYFVGIQKSHQFGEINIKNNYLVMSNISQKFC